MSSFKHVVKNYENLAKLGRQIIQHKKDVKNIKSDNLEKAFFIQRRIFGFKKILVHLKAFLHTPWRHTCQF